MLFHVIPPRGKYRTYRGRFRVGDNPKIYSVTLPTTVKEVALKLLKERHEDMQREVHGLIPMGHTRRAMQRPLLDLFGEFLEELRQRGRSAEYQRVVRTRFPVLAKECRWNTLKDVTAKSYADWRNAQTRYSARSLNHFLTDAKTFFNWVDRTYEVPNPLSRLQKVSVDPAHPEGPRAFTEDELNRLFAASKKWRLLYRLLAFTGLRRKEAKELLWGDVHFGDNPCLKLRAESTKARRADTIPLAFDLARELQAARSELAKATDRVFWHGLASYTGLNRDLTRAKIALVDDYGRSAGFHTFRRTFITLGQNLGIAPRVLQQLARHKSLNLTNNVYTDSTKLDLRSAIEKVGKVLHVFEPPKITCPLSQNSGQTGVSESSAVQ